MPFDRRSASRTYGFTLTEVVVSISIIAVASLITFGVFMKAKDGAKDTQVLANLKQIGASHFVYAADNDDGLPGILPVNGGKPVAFESGESKRPPKPGDVKFYKEDAKGWKALLAPYGAANEMFFSPADPYARSNKPLYGTTGPSSSSDSSITYCFGAVATIDVIDGRVYWTLSKAEERSRERELPFLVTNIFEPSSPVRAATVHRLGRRVPSWYLEGNARILDLKKASPIHE